MASQALLVTLVPTIVAIGADLDASVPAVSQARTVTAAVAVTTSLALISRIGTIGVPRLLQAGSALALVASAAVASAPNLPVFLAAHALVGVAVACLLTSAFAGVTAFDRTSRPWAVGHVAGANALAWVVVNPVAGSLTDWISWRAAHLVPAAFGVATLATAHAVAVAAEKQQGLPLAVLRADKYARRWIGAELLAYSCWTGLLTFIGAFVIATLELTETATGWLLAAGAASFYVAATRLDRLVSRVSVRRLAASAGAAMAALLPALFSVRGGLVLTMIVFCLIGVSAGVRTPASSELGLELLPGYATAMMAIRTAVVHLGYLIGAVVGGAVIAASGYSALGWVLAAGMAVSAVLVLGVREPAKTTRDTSPD